jgi:hypothetical protein
MRMPTALRKLDDRVLGSKRRPDTSDHAHVYPDTAPHPVADERVDRTHDHGPDQDAPATSSGDGALQALGVVWKVSRLVFLLLAVVVIVGLIFTLAPTNEDNVIVRNGLSLAETVAGPFKNVFTADDADRELIYNYGLAIGVYLLAASLITKLPGASKV